MRRNSLSSLPSSELDEVLNPKSDTSRSPSSPPDFTSLLLDELILSILSKLPESSQHISNSVVCKRWSRLSGRIILSLKLLDDTSQQISGELTQIWVMVVVNVVVVVGISVVVVCLFGNYRGRERGTERWRLGVGLLNPQKPKSPLMKPKFTVGDRNRRISGDVDPDEAGSHS